MHFTRKEGLKTQETESKEEDSEEHRGQLSIERNIPAALRKEGRK